MNNLELEKHEIIYEDHSIADELVFPEPSSSPFRLTRFFFENRITLFRILLVFVSIVVLLRLFDIRFHVMSSDSMESMIPVDSLVITRAVPPMTLRVGDVITYENQDGRSITHQIQSIVPNFNHAGITVYIMRGVDNQHVDEQIVKPNQIIGRYVFHVPWVGSLLFR